MEAPPPYMPPRKKSNTGLIIGLVIGGLVLCCIGPIALLVGGGFWIFNKAMPIAGCSFAFVDARDAMRDYAKDHNGNLPPADNWQEEVRPYYDKLVAAQLKQRGPIKSMPSAGAWGCDDGSGGHTGMAFNDDVAGKSFTDAEKSEDVLLFEIKQATANAHRKYELDSIPDSPKMFGQPRGWFFIKAYGDAILHDAAGRDKPVRTGSGISTGD